MSGASDNGLADYLGDARNRLRILVLAPTQNDGRLSQGFLRAAGLHADICADMRELCKAIREGCSAILIAEEALEGENGTRLVKSLAEQPSWSDIPVAIIISGGNDESRERMRRLTSLEPIGNVTLIERPFRPGTLVSIFRVALRSRRRQYQVRDLLEEREAMSRKVQQQARVFNTMLSAMTDFAYILDREGRFVYANNAMLDAWGLKLYEIVGRNFSDLGYSNELSVKLHRQLKEILNTGQVVRDETPYTTPAGTNGYYEYIFSPVFAADGTVEAIAGSSRDTTARRLTEEALRNAGRRKDEFLAMLAHELRNPLASVLGAATVLKGADDNGNHEWAASVIEHQSGHLARLIDDLLDVSRITSGKIRLRKKLIDAATVMARACESARPLCNERRHLLTCDFERGKFWLEADPTRLEQVILNLLTNAAKYTQAGGKINLRAFCKANQVVIEIQDNGIGVAPDRLPEMFELFTQGERSIARSEGGLGLGLTIVKRLTEMHNGRIEAFSEGIDRGSVFTIYMPLAAAPVPGIEAEENSCKQWKKRRIIVVDDNVDTAQALVRLLKRDGHELYVAYDGYAALEKARACSPEVVLLDIGLPEMDGYEVAARMREEPRCANALIVALSGYGQDEDRRRSKAAGFDYHLVKPADMGELKELVSRDR
ncbi:MAG: putative histidine kinase, hybrid [Chthoniobacteraceae bacterium]|nr:putative histidine kinase, hybrid [Chthoniobacteraceae bacterium]